MVLFHRGTGICTINCFILYALFASIGLITLTATHSFAQGQAFLDNFNRLTLTASAPTTYSTTITPGDGGASITSGTFLELTNDTSAAANADGIVYVAGLTQDFSSGYDQSLQSNNCIIEWTFNFRFNRSSNPSGLNSGSYGTAIILACSNGIFTGAEAGNGYAVVFGSSGTPDPIRLVRFSGGLSGSMINIISSGNNDISAVNNYASVRVTYNPYGSNWSLYIRDDGASNWSDPSQGVTAQKGTSSSDNTYTSTLLTHFGFYWAYATSAVQTSQFDNYKVVLTLSTTPTIAVNSSAIQPFGDTKVGESSGSQNITVSGVHLIDNLIIHSPSGFELRTGTNTFSAGPITLIPTDGIVEQTNIDIRFSPENAYSYTDTIKCTSAGADAKYIIVSGTGISSGLELYLTSDPLHADADHAAAFPQAGMGNGTLNGADDWSYNSPVLSFYATPAGTLSFCASEFEINWDAARAALSVSNGNMFDFMAVSTISAGKVKVNAGASSNLNVSPAAGKYIVKLDFSILQPGSNEITITGTDFRCFDGASQQNLQVASHPGTIKFFLGDFVSQGVITSEGDGRINFNDLIQFASAYFGESDGEPAGYKAKFDIGPTNSSGSYFAMPNPDGQIQFEDLAVFSIGYGKSAALQLPKRNMLPVSFGTQAAYSNEEDIIIVPLSVLGSHGNIRSISVTFDYPPPLLEYIGVEKRGEMDQARCFMAAHAKNKTIILDAAVMDSEKDGLSDDGVFAQLKFKKLVKTGNYDISIQSAKARDRNNRDLEVQINKNENSQSDLPAAFSLSQNFPNPFNPATTIRFQLSAFSYTSLKIFDILGREVMTLISEPLPAGTYTRQWNASDMPGGIYFYQMIARDVSAAPGAGFIDVR
ncbi:MAG: T9SS C-terminal target domain-containing protein, partial [Ignavibacteriae bacterium]